MQTECGLYFCESETATGPELFRAPIFALPEASKDESSTWVHLVPRGEHRDMGYPPAPGFQRRSDNPKHIVSLWDREALDALQENFRRDLLVDYEHSDQSSDPASSTAAAGWGQALREVADGLELEISWTPTGRAQVRGKEYRFISPVVDGIWQNLEGGETADDPVVFRPRRLLEAGLTNRPRLKGRLRPLSNKKESGGPGERDGHEPNETMNENTKKLLCSVLNLEAGKTDEAKIEAKLGEFVGGELATMRNRANEAADLKKKVEALEEERLEADLEAYADVITEKDSARALFRADREAAKKAFGGMRERQPAGEDKPPHTAMHNRASAKPPQEPTGEDDGERYMARAIQIQNETGCSLGEADRRARAEAG